MIHHAASADAFISDLREATEQLINNPDAFASGSSQLFKLQVQINDSGSADALLTELLGQAMTEGVAPTAECVGFRLGL